MPRSGPHLEKKWSETLLPAGEASSGDRSYPSNLMADCTIGGARPSHGELMEQGCEVGLLKVHWVFRNASPMDQ